jgi:hypothetical protein
MLAIVLAACAVVAIGAFLLIWLRRPVRQSDPARWPQDMTLRAMERLVTAWLEEHGWKVDQRQFGVLWAAKQNRLASVRCYTKGDALTPSTIGEWGRRRGANAWAEVAILVRPPAPDLMQAADHARVTLLPYPELDRFEPIVFRHVAEALRGRAPQPSPPR